VQERPSGAPTKVFSNQDDFQDIEHEIDP
jgi:hypothetical protein